MLAVIGLAKLKVELPSVSEAETDTSLALWACGELLYWNNRVDLPPDVLQERCASIWSSLLHHDLGVAADALMRFEMRVAFQDWRPVGRAKDAVFSIASLFPEHVTEVCKAALQRLDKQRSYFGDMQFRYEAEHGRGIAAFAITALGEWGDTSALPLLRQFVEHDRLSGPALDAIRSIEVRAAENRRI
jgi:hypothetical protein